MNSKRSLFVIAFLFLSFLLYQQWQIDHNPVKPVQANATVASGQTGDLDAVGASDFPSTASENTNFSQTASNNSKLVTLTSDVLAVTIDTNGGDIVDSKLLKYAKTQGSEERLDILENSKDLVYIAQSGLIGRDGVDKSTTGRANYTVDGTDFTLKQGDSSVSAVLTYSDDKTTVQKIFTLEPNSYVVKIDYKITNKADHNLEMTPFAQFKHTLIDSSSNLAMPTYNGAAYSTDETNYKKYSFDDMKDKNLNLNSQNGWIGILQHYFVSAWVPTQKQAINFYTTTNPKFAFVGFKSQNVVIPVGQTVQLEERLWTGPKLQEEMAKVTVVGAEHLDLSVDYGWAWFIAKPLFKLLKFIQSWVSNWGLAIIGITIIVKGLLYPLTKAQYTSMAKMRMLAPRIKEMRENFGDDRQRLSQETMKLYKEEKVNPLGGCLPILLQMPIFIALYWTFLEAVELRHAPFFGWITDLSAQDPYYILPVLMGVSMFLLQKMSPTPISDPMQQKIMMFMPVIFCVFFLWFPAGLVLYWLSSNIITMLQQQIIYRNLEKKGLHYKEKKVKKAKKA